MTNMRPFQLVLLAVFGFLAVVALIFLSAFQMQKSEEEQVYGEEVVIWGTFPQKEVKNVLQEIANTDKPFNVVTYYQVPEETFDAELVNAIAEGRSPDLVVLKSDALVKHRAKLYPIPYDSLSRRTFQDTYVDGAELFALQDGIYAFPLAIDPVVMYWNRDMFTSNGLAQAPKTWEEIVNEVVPRLTRRDTQRNVLQSAVAFGEYRNVMNAKLMLMLLCIQSGSRMISEGDHTYEVLLNESLVEGGRAPLESAVQFYTDFSNVNSPLYSWNRALPMDKNAFLAGDLGLYFGRGSELQDISDKNPNLNFDVAEVPQGASATVRRTSGDLYGLAIPRATKNARGAYAAAQVLARAEYASALSSALGMSSARRDVIAQGEEDPYRQVILQSALITRGWLDPSAEESNEAFMQMVEDIVSNRARISEAVDDAIKRLIMLY